MSSREASPILEFLERVPTCIGIPGEILPISFFICGVGEWILTYIGFCEEVSPLFFFFLFRERSLRHFSFLMPSFSPLEGTPALSCSQLCRNCCTWWDGLTLLDPMGALPLP